MPAFYIKNFGCRANQAEAFAWTEELKASGLAAEKNFNSAQLIIVNSCTLTHRADRDVFKFIRKVSRENPGGRIAVTGCLAERLPETLNRLPGVVMVVGNREKISLLDKIFRCEEMWTKKLTGSNQPQDVAREAEKIAATDSYEAADVYRSRAMVKIQDGCSQRCSFCIIPSVRGRNYSLPVENVLYCLRRFVDQGFREVVLAGIHLTSYGGDLSPRQSLLSLLREIEKLEGLSWVRLSSLDPRHLTSDLLSYLTGSPRVAQHFHLSLQHVSEKILKMMGRDGGPETYKNILNYLRKNSPAAALGADVIVGFPGETEADFLELKDFLSESPLSYFHVFNFSPRKGTAAAAMKQLPEKVKAERSKILRQISAGKNFEFRKSLQGQEFRGIVVRGGDELTSVIPAKAKAGSERGGRSDEVEVLTENYLRIYVPARLQQRRAQVRVRLVQALPKANMGIVVE